MSEYQLYVSTVSFYCPKNKAFQFRMLLGKFGIDANDSFAEIKDPNSIDKAIQENRLPGITKRQLSDDVLVMITKTHLHAPFFNAFVDNYTEVLTAISWVLDVKINAFMVSYCIRPGSAPYKGGTSSVAKWMKGQMCSLEELLTSNNETLRKAGLIIQMFDLSTLKFCKGNV
jgi:hypothetical protein